MSWDTTAVVDAPPTLTVSARDAVGNVGTATLVVNIPVSPYADTERDEHRAVIAQDRQQRRCGARC